MHAFLPPPQRHRVARQSRPHQAQPRTSCGMPFAGLLLTSVISLAGCSKPQGPELAPVTGTVLLDGQPLAGARVVFQPSGQQASPSTAITDESGRFRLAFNRDRNGAIVGQHRVQITTAGIAVDEAGNETVIPERLPPRFHSKSELQYDVKSGSNDFEIPLQLGGKSPTRPAANSAGLPNPC